MATIALTGGTGLVGRHAAPALLAAGHRLRCLVRDPAAAAPLEALGAELVPGDLADESSLARAFDGCDAVVASAALYTIRRQSWDAFARPNVEGTERVLRAAASAGATRVIHVSSTAVYRQRAGRVLDEDAAQLSEDDVGRARAYAVSKAVSEQRAWSLAEALGLRLTCLRPCAIYGSQDRQFLPTLARFQRWPLLVVPDVGMPLVHAGDVAAAAVSALASEASVGRSYNLASAPVGFAELFRTWRAVRGSGARVVRIPVPLRFAYRTEAAQRDLGFSARSLADGLREAEAGGYRDRAA